MDAQPSSGIRFGRVLGIPLYVHSSWFIIFALITFSLATQFRSEYPGWTPTQFWTLGIITSLLFFASVLIHELGHSTVALRYRIPVVSITLFVFGGLARIGREPSSAKQEFNIAIAGPLTSFTLAVLFYFTGQAFAKGTMVNAAGVLLGQVNFILAVFNLVPGFPLDGGRIFRAIAWAITGDFTRATRFASMSGQFFAYLMIFYGIWEAVTGRWVSGLWLAFIGWFLLSAAQESYAAVAVRRTLQGLKAADVMTQEMPTVDRSISLEDYLHEVLRTGRRCHLVMGNGQLVGMITLHNVRSVPREDWPLTSVQAAMIPREKIHWAQSTEPALDIMDRMQSEDINQMPVLEDGHVVGLISRESLLRVIQTRLQIGRLAEQ
jgi:Zn-dependent protease/predicted transcriptional regulator